MFLKLKQWNLLAMYEREEGLPRLFQPFVQIDTRLARDYEGTGLGLALVKQLTEVFGGHIDVESTYGQGCRFTVPCLGWTNSSC